MTDEDIEDMVADYKAGRDMVIYVDDDIRVFSYTCRSGEIIFFSLDWELDDKYRKLISG